MLCVALVGPRDVVMVTVVVSCVVFVVCVDVSMPVVLRVALAC